ncbi:MAG: TIGR02757 family protein, partial [Bacteroidales bacterium]
DPVQIPHLFSSPEDIEIAAFLTSIFAWGRRETIIRNSRSLMRSMGMTPYDFVLNAGKDEIDRTGGFCHRTFQGTDCIYFIESLRNIYTKHGGLKTLFETPVCNGGSIKESLIHFRKVFFEIPHPARTLKHIPDVGRGSTAKRLNMFLRWMVRSDNRKVDFGIWKGISPADLFLPLDVHTGSVARNLGLLKRKSNDWKTVEEVTENLRKLDPVDPVKYDFALFGLGIYGGF